MTPYPPIRKLDHAEKIYYLTLIIKNICEENDLPKYAVLQDFIELLLKDEKEEKND